MNNRPDRKLIESIRNEFDLQTPRFYGSKGNKPMLFKDFKTFPTNKELVTRYERRKTDLEHSLSHESIEKILFHGTPIKNFDDIKVNGCKTNMDGMHGHAGQGFYLSTLIHQAMYYQLKDVYIGDETELSVIVCKLLLGTCSDVKRATHTNCICKSCLDTPCDTHRIPYSEGRGVDKIQGFEYCSKRDDNILPVGILRMTVSEE